MKAMAYFKVLKVIKSTNFLSCNLWTWLFKLKDSNILNEEEFIILAELYDNKTRRRTMRKAPNDSIGQMEKKKMCREVFWI
jgi:hypothetical protein